MNIVLGLDWVSQIEFTFVPLVVENSCLVDGVVAAGLFAVSRDGHLDVAG